jgi:uncharacterized protein YPO0396
MISPELTLFSKEAHTAGFRMERFEVFNWGAFHEQVYVMPLQGENALLTGANGAGKTTLVDAMITLLNPTPERYYNQSAGFEDRKRTRKLEDYVLGVFGHSENGREQLRNKAGQQASYTVILGVFHNKDTGQSLTLAHLYWFRQTELQKKYYVSASALNITDHFRFLGDVRKFGNDLAKSFRVETFDSFSEYANYMQPKLGMRFSEKGKSAASRTKPLQLLAKTAGIKVLGNLDSFIREHMLDEAQLETNFDQLKKEYADIAETQKTLDKARKQEEMLLPMLDKNLERIKNEDELNRKLMVNRAVGPYFAKYHVQLLEVALADLGAQLQENANKLEGIKDQLDTHRKDEYQLKTQIDSHDAGKRLQDLQNKANDWEKELKSRHNEANKYAQIARSVGLEAEVDAALFYAQRNQIAEKASVFQADMDKIDSTRDQLVSEKHSLTSQQRQIAQELESLKGRENNLPSEYIRLRAQMMTDLGLQADQVPYVAELLQLKPAEKNQWQHGIEKLLSPFALHLLVSKKHLKQVITWVRQNNTGTLLRFTEAEMDAPEAIFADQNPQAAAYKLEIKDKTPYREWLKAELFKRYKHHCTTDTQEYERKTQALTPDGLFKNEKQHQKDDRKHRSNSYLLGWDNQDAIHRLSAELTTTRQQIAELEKRMQPLDSSKSALLTQLTDLKRLFDFEQYGRIDFASTQEALSDALAQIDELNKTSDAYRLLKDRLDLVQKAIRQSEIVNHAATERKGNLEARVQQHQIELLKHQTDIGEGQELDIYRIAVEQFVGEIPELNLETIERKRKEIEKRLSDETNGHQVLKSQLEKELERMMALFKNPKKDILEAFPSWPDDTDALGSPIIEHISAYTDLLSSIQNDALPKLAQRFEARTSVDMSKSFLLFERSLKEQLGDHEDHIKNMNLALRALPYTHDTYLQIVTEANYRRGRIGEFCAMLEKCQLDQTALKLAHAQEQQEILRNVVNQIGILIQKLDSQPDWRREVTDVRNWLSFKTQQVYQATDTVMVGTLQDSTSGKSGGEQAKLTYTVLAAALTYQFNITNQHNAHSFRFIVVDEAFSKLDPENSTYLMKLLSSLKFQMLIITPNNFSKANEDLMSHLIYIQKISENPPQSAAYHFTKLAWKEKMSI